MQQIVPIATGSDIELFLQDKTTNEIISAEGYIQGSKYEPFVFDPSNKYFATSLDNVLCEFCIPPVNSAEEFYANIQKSIGYINSILPEDYCTVALPAARLHERWLQTHQSRVFGCEADFNAYTRYMNQPPSSDDVTLRSAGFHLHLSYEGATPYDQYDYEPDADRCNIVKAFDLFLGVPSIVTEPDNRRKELYGKAGSFRPKPYGLEYRTLSNYHVNSEGSIKWVYNAQMAAINWLNAGNTVDAQLGLYIQHTINTNNKEQAKQIINQFNLAII